MQTPQNYFKGFLLIKISRAGKIRLPREWSNLLSGRYFLELCRGDDLTFIQLVSEKMLSEMAAAEMNLETKDARETVGVSEYERREVLLGSLPYLILPLDWCEAAGIESSGKLYIAGKGMSLEFWGLAGFDAMLEREIQMSDEPSLLEPNEHDANIEPDARIATIPTNLSNFMNRDQTRFPKPPYSF